MLSDQVAFGGAQMTLLPLMLIEDKFGLGPAGIGFVFMGESQSPGTALGVIKRKDRRYAIPWLRSCSQSVPKQLNLDPHRYD